jgi:hypothetical protein
MAGRGTSKARHPSRRAALAAGLVAAMLGAAAALSGIGVALGAVPAQAAETLGDAVQITTVPAYVVSTVSGTSTRAPSATAGGLGSPRANDAVRTACTDGSAYADPQWFTLPGWRGKLAVRRLNQTPFEVGSARARFAVLDADSLTVLNCSADVIALDPTQPRLLVAYYPGHDGCTEDEDAGYFCSQYPETRTDYQLAWTSGSAPANDRWQDATVVGSLPYVGTVDTTFATVDDRDVTFPPSCFGFGASVTASAWWKLTPASTGPLWFGSGATWGEASFVLVVPALPAGGPDLAAAESLAGCGGFSKPLTAGKTYYVAVYNVNDNSDGYHVEGSQAVLRLAADSAVMSRGGDVELETDPAARSATIGARVGVRVARDGTDSGGAGPWSGIADTSPFTFTHLRPWVSYQLSAAPAQNPEFGLVRAVFLSSPTPSVPRSVKAAPGTSKATVTWRPPAFVGNSQVTGYTVRKYLVTSTGSILQQRLSLPVSARTYTFTGLTAGKSYRFNATALNSQGAGVTSAKTTALTP